MAQITTDSQRELRNAIETQFGNLFEMIINNAAAYKLCADINEACTRYFMNAQILTENQNTKEFQQL